VKLDQLDQLNEREVSARQLPIAADAIRMNDHDRRWNVNHIEATIFNAIKNRNAGGIIKFQAAHGRSKPMAGMRAIKEGGDVDRTTTLLKSSKKFHSNSSNF
jgi:hypothetical protein